jgi:hypothetical protein
MIRPLGGQTPGRPVETPGVGRPLGVFLGAKSTSIRDCVGLSVRRSVLHDARLRGKLVTSRLLREEEEEEEADYVAIPLRRDSITSRFLRT